MSSAGHTSTPRFIISAFNTKIIHPGMPTASASASQVEYTMMKQKKSLHPKPLGTWAVVLASGPARVMIIFIVRMMPRVR